MPYLVPMLVGMLIGACNLMLCPIHVIRLLKIADIVEANHEFLAKVETLDNGKAIRESMVGNFF